MSITRWDPFREMLSLREAMDQLLEQSVIPSGAMGGRGTQGGAMTLALDVADRDDAYEVKASLPGVRPEDIQVTVQGDTLTIRAETGGEEEHRQGNYLLRERRRGVMQRTVVLPSPIEPGAVQANYENGVLTLRLAKSQASRPRQIEVRAGGGGERQQATGQIAGRTEGERQQATTQAGQSRAEGERTQRSEQAQGQQAQAAGQTAGQTPAEAATSQERKTAGQEQAARSRR